LFKVLRNKKSNFTPESPEYYISEIMGKKIYDNYGHQVGSVKDLVAIWNGGYPQVVGIKFAHSTEIIPIECIAEWGPNGVFLHERPRLEKVRPIASEEIFVNRWLLDKQIIDIRGAKVVRVNDIKLRWQMQDNKLAVYLVAVDIGLRGIIRRLGLKSLSNKFQEHLLDWQSFNPLEDRNASLQLIISREGLDDLHPADLADILEDLSQNDQSQFLRYLNPETAADTLAEVETETRSQLLEGMDSSEASALVQAMAPDEAADVLGELSRGKRLEILRLMNPEEAQEVKELMDYSEGTAGSLMTTEMITVPYYLTVQQVIDRLREIAPSIETVYYVFITDNEEHLLGVISLRELIIAAPNAGLDSIMRKNVITLKPDEDFEEVLEVTVKYNLLAVPVVDEDSQEILGIVTVDDVLDTLRESKRKHPDKYSYLQSLRAFRS
jgi:magnesium transporter